MSVLLIQGDARRLPLADSSVDTCVTSPPYWALRSYGIGTEYGEIGLEPLHDCNGAFTGNACGACWVCAMRAVFAEVHRVMRPEATLWLNVGDAYAGDNRPGWRPGNEAKNGGVSNKNGIGFVAGIKPKSLLGLPWRLALALQADGWILRSEIIWAKKNCMPESVQDRPTRAHEQVFMFSKQAKYYYDGEAVKEPSVDPESYNGMRYRQPETITNYDQGYDGHRTRIGLKYRTGAMYPTRAMRSVLSLASEPTPYAHFATFPTELVRKCLLAGAPTQVCRACGKPWVRQVEHGPPDKLTTRGQQAWTAVTGQRDSFGGLPWRPITTTGFVPPCHCGAPGDGKAVVFDPFCGSGTTLLVARELGHHGIGTDLSLPYLRDIARERLGMAALHEWKYGAEARPATYSDLPLFAMEQS